MHLFVLALLLGATAAVLVPSTPGPYDVAVKHIELIDQDRIDRLAPEAGTARRFMASAYLPVDAKYNYEAQIARTGDQSFLISQLSNTTVTQSLFANFPGTLDSHRVISYGHSFGGSTAATTAMLDSRVVGGANLDGPIYGTVGQLGFKGKLFLQITMSASVGNNSTSSFPEWDEFYDKIDAAMMHLVVKDTQHYAFTDVPLLLTVYEVPPASQPMVDEVFGKLSGRRLEKAINDIMVGLRELLFSDDTEPLAHVDSNPYLGIIRNDLPTCK
ncbi:hypothetical protein ACHAQH_009632 [Verticillium albo-atrum]